MRADVTLVIPVWNRADLLKKLLASIAAQTRRPERVVMVDNGSTDEAAEVARNWGAEVVAMGRNAGFAAAVNRGVAESRSEWVAVVNSDVELKSEWLEKLLASAEDADAWFATGKILMASDPARLDGSWDLIAKSGCPWRAGHGAPDSELFARQRPIAMAPATAVLYRRALFGKVGGFTEQFESYLEDVELSLRCAAAGLEGVYEPAAVCLHEGSASTGVWSDRVTYLNSRNQILLTRLFPSDLRREWRWKIFAGQGLWGLAALRHGRFGSWLRGKRDARTIQLGPALGAGRLRALLKESEREIHALQSRTRASFYWRLYFLFTGIESE